MLAANQNHATTPTKLWSENLGKADALWQAKVALRNEGHGPRDWAAWVLTGDPD